MSGGTDIAEALEKQTQVIKLLKNGGFTLRKWASNESEALQNIPKEYTELQGNKTIDFDPTIKTLGLNWNFEADTFSYKVKFNPVTNSPTKRSILSDVSKLYDPLGWISPITIVGKILIQTLSDFC